MSDVIAALERLSKTPEFGLAIIEAQMLNTLAYVIYDGQEWTLTTDQAKIKQAKMSISLPRLKCEAYQLFAEVYLDDHKNAGLFSERWQGSEAQRHCADETRFALTVIIELDQVLGPPKFVA